MAILNIVKEGDPVLRGKCREVTEITPRVITLLDDMKETLHKAEGCGLAAPQVGVRRRICIVEVEEGELIEMINPDDIPPITEMFTDISANSEKPFEAHCRFMVQGDYHWFFLSCKPVFGGYGKPIHFEGTMCDVSTYLETAGDDLVYKEFKKKHNIKLSELKKGSVGLEEVLDRDYLASIQKPFATRIISM